jgi:hypothetical protein
MANNNSQPKVLAIDPSLSQNEQPRAALERTLAIVRFASGRRRCGFEHPFDVAKSINERFSRSELVFAPTATYNVLLYFINLRFRKVKQNVLL